MRFPIRAAALLLLLLVTGCNSVKVKLSGDKGVRYTAAWQTKDGMKTESGAVPESYRFKDEEFTATFRNNASSGAFRVRVYQGWSLVVDETVFDSAQRIKVERKGNGISVSK